LAKVLRPMGFTDEKIKACLGDQKILDGVNWVHDRADKEFGVDATPTFFFNGQKHEGELTIDDVEKIITPMLK
jgi:protein-disulfide isomerase